MRQYRRLLQVGAALLAVTFLVYQLKTLHRPPTIYQNVDPQNFVKYSILVLNDPAYIVTGQISPSLRYIPFAIPTAILSPLGIPKSTVVSWTAASTAFVAIPVSAIIVAWATRGPTPALAATIAVCILSTTAALNLTDAYLVGRWQDLIVVPPLLAAIGLAVLDVEHRLPWWGPWLVGTLLGIAGALQVSNTVLGILVVAALYASQFRVRGLVRVSAAGSAWLWTVLRPPVLQFYLGRRQHGTAQWEGLPVMTLVGVVIAVSVFALGSLLILDYLDGVSVRAVLTSPWVVVGVTVVGASLLSVWLLPFLVFSAKKFIVFLLALAGIGAITDVKRSWASSRTVDPLREV